MWYQKEQQFVNKLHFHDDVASSFAEGGEILQDSTAKLNKILKITWDMRIGIGKTKVMMCSKYVNTEMKIELEGKRL